MRKGLFFGALILLCAAISFAQDSNSTGGAPQSGANANSGSATATSQTSTTDQNSGATPGSTVQGCLSGSSGSYMLTDATGVTYQLQGDDSQFSANVNTEVEVSGTPGATASASASNAPGAAPSGNDATGPANGTSNNPSSTETGAAHANANAAKTLTVSSIHKVADSCPAKETPQQ